MASKFGQLKGEIDKLRKDSLSVVQNANKIVYSGVQKLADRELKALNDYYRSALEAIRSADRKQGLRDMAHHQLDLLQDTVNQVIAHARESMSIVAEARTELSRLVDRGVHGGKVGKAELERAAAPARKAVGKAKAAAQKAVQKAVKKATRKITPKAAAKPVKKARAATRKAVASGRRTAVAARKVATRAVKIGSGAPESRASRATSRAQHAARGALNSVSTLSASVSSALSSFTDAVRSKG
jgi:light-regulated signal transduction histidine kinase (bacteriophytochrome)